MAIGMDKQRFIFFLNDGQTKWVINVHAHFNEQQQVDIVVCNRGFHTLARKQTNNNAR